MNTPPQPHKDQEHDRHRRNAARAADRHRIDLQWLDESPPVNIPLAGVLHAARREERRLRP
jgi:hypothetical protein